MLQARLPLFYIPGIIISAIIGGLFPDIDWHTSKVGATVKPISRIINTLFGHRTLFHSPILYILIYIAFTHNCPTYYWLILPFVIGAGVHLFLDMFNRKGISLFYPHSKRYHFMSLKNNGVGEWAIRTALFLLTGITSLVLVLKILINIIS